jgi:NAD(P)H-flavin reductase/ferredoxin
VALPWLPLRRRRGTQATHRVVRLPEGDAWEVRPGETILDAGLREGQALPHECRNGGCGACVCTVLAGRIDPGPFQPAALTEAMRAQGQALMCCARPLDDLEIAIALEPGRAPARPAAREHLVRVARLEHLSPDLVRLRLALVRETRLPFRAGQYLNVLLDDGQRRAFSFANAPQHDDHIELHVRRIPGGRFTGHVFTRMQVGDTLRLEGPLGDFTLRESDRPILFVAGATGFAPVKSMVEDAFARGLARPMWLYWGARRPADLYAGELAAQWQRTHANFHFVPVLSNAAPDDAWQGRTGLVHEAMLADFPDLTGAEVYVCGSVKMVEAAVPAFLANGLEDGLCFTDAFLPSASTGRSGGA